MARSDFDTIYTRSGTESEWLRVDPILGFGEEGYVTDKRMSKHGDGTSKFSELPYDGANIDTTYTGSGPIPVDIGGFKAGDSAPTDMSFTEIFNKLLYPYVKPDITISASPSTGYREYTNNVTSTTMTATVTQKTRDIEKVEFIVNGTVVGTVTSPTSTTIDSSTQYTKKTYKFTYNGEISSGTTNGSASARSLKAKVYDNEGSVESSAANYTFVSPTYIGSVDSNITPDNITDSMVRGLSTKKVIAKASNYASAVTQVYSVTEQKFIYAYPKAFGALVCIIDGNGYDIISDFDIKEINVTQYDGTTTVPYYVYIDRNVVSLSNYSVKYAFHAKS